ncbi:hypothetical protein D3C74_386040 [compost metagenome]
MIKSIQEVSLIFVVVHTTQQLERAVLFNEASIMASSYIICAEIQRFVQELTEFDLTITHDIRVRRTTRLIFIKEIGKYFIKIFFLEVDSVVRNADLFAYAAYIL